MITKYRALVHPDHVKSQFHAHRCSWCKQEFKLTGVEVDGLMEMACPRASKHVEDQERWVEMSKVQNGQ